MSQLNALSKFSFLVSFFELYPSNFNFIEKTVPFPYTDIMIIKQSYWNWSFKVSLWALIDNSFWKYSQKIFANWFVYWSFGIDRRKQRAFWIRESQTNNTSTSTTKMQAFCSKEGTEEHDFQETFDHYREEVFFESLDFAINE